MTDGGDTAAFRSGFVAVVGRPNAGKSTLVNQLVGDHVAIVSARAQTTRRTIRACAHLDNAQVVFVDLPGSQRPLDRMTSRMQAAVDASLADVDAVLWVIDATEEIGKGERHIGDRALASGRPVVIALNKIDMTNPPKVATAIASLAAFIGERTYEAIVPVSAETGESCDVLMEQVLATVPEGPPVFPDDMITDLRDEERIAEHIREAALPELHEELPHALAVEIDELDDDGDVLHVHAFILVEAESQVGIVVGKGGTRIRDIGTRARGVIEAALGRHVHLDLRVRARRDWRNSDAELDRLGL